MIDQSRHHTIVMKNIELFRPMLMATVCGLLSLSMQSQITAETPKANITEKGDLKLANNAQACLLHVEPQSIESLRAPEPNEMAPKPKPIIFDGFQIQIEKVVAKTESVQAGMQKPGKIHQIMLKLSTQAQDESNTDFIAPQISVIDSEGKIDVTYTHVFRSNTATSRTYQYNLSRKPEDPTVSILFKNADGETLSLPREVTNLNRSSKLIENPRTGQP